MKMIKWIAATAFFFCLMLGMSCSAYADAGVAEAAGSAVVIVTDSDISVRNKSETAVKAPASVNPSEVVSTAAKVATTSIVESIMDDDDFSHTVSSVVVNVIAGTVRPVICMVSKVAMDILLAKIGLPAAEAVVGILICCAGEVLCILVEESNLKEVIASLVDNIGNGVTKAYENVESFVSDLNMKDSFEQATEAVGAWVDDGVASTRSFVSNLSETVRRG